jgi:hypothetical protein
MELSFIDGAAALCEPAAETQHQQLHSFTNGLVAADQKTAEPAEWNDTEVLDSCLRRIRSWRVPPNWSAIDWFGEMRLQGAAAIWQARQDYDAARGVPLSAFERLRVLASARTRYRQEWRYALHCPSEDAEWAEEGRADEPVSSVDICNPLPEALARIPETDRWLIEQLFWDGCSEAAVAQRLGISQPAVSKRKTAILKQLRRSLAAT